MAQYGASAEGIAYATGVSVEYAKEFLETEARLFPQSIAFRGVVRAEVERTGELPEGLPAVAADPDGLLQMVDNILDNAIKYSPEGTEVRMSWPLQKLGRPGAQGRA